MDDSRPTRLVSTTLTLHSTGADPGFVERGGGGAHRERRRREALFKLLGGSASGGKGGGGPRAPWIRACSSNSRP